MLDAATIEEAKLLGNQHKEVISDITIADSSIEHVDPCLTLGRSGSVTSLSFRHDSLPTSAKEIGIDYCPIEANNECNKSRNNLVGLGLDLNSDYTLNIAEHNPFYPFKNLREIKSTDASECGSTTGPFKESEPLRMWKQMKQNGFLSSSHGGIPMPKQQSHQPRKRKDDKLQCMGEFAKREQVGKFAKFVAPSGLLSGLNPGIINHVRNSKQVHSIIEAIVQYEKHDVQTHNKITDCTGRGSKNTNERRKDHTCTYDSLYASKPSFPSSRGYTGEVKEIDTVRCNLQKGVCSTSQITTECKDDGLTLKLSSATALVSENANSTTTDEFSANQGNFNSLSLEAANVASQWLDLLQQDIKGRLAALRRSRKRVRNVLQTELPYLLTKEFMFNEENEPCFAISSELGASTKSISEMHVARWKSLFGQMDKSLYDEGKQLDNWLKQVQEMQLHCENGLKFVSDASSHLGSASNPSSNVKKSDAQHAVWAAAASIYSTSNWIMTKENV
ncbi:hypothetical protein Cni_G15580 [Canna indica]|uniref:Uncharacterized protein n=1 Tax=Canna indica TaxID=4628 RepID=A0AAQ3QBR1_9LILI|nr:hypothetical protein Cni_G15580 [Canna indica]